MNIYNKIELGNNRLIQLATYMINEPPQQTNARVGPMNIIMEDNKCTIVPMFYFPISVLHVVFKEWVLGKAYPILRDQPQSSIIESIQSFFFLDISATCHLLCPNMQLISLYSSKVLSPDASIQEIAAGILWFCQSRNVSRQLAIAVNNRLNSN